jgi:hypothetical protein
MCLCIYFPYDRALNWMLYGTQKNVMVWPLEMHYIFAPKDLCERKHYLKYPTTETKQMYTYRRKDEQCGV